jgi:hypothetical protein
MSELTDALLKAQAELPTAIGRDSQGYGYRYTSLDKLIAETRPILNRHGVYIGQAPAYVDEVEGARPVLITTLRCGDEDTQFTTPLYVTDKTMQGYGAAITYARRYAWAAVLGIASEEDTDAALPKDAEDVPF